MWEVAEFNSLTSYKRYTNASSSLWAEKSLHPQWSSYGEGLQQKLCNFGSLHLEKVQAQETSNYYVTTYSHKGPRATSHYTSKAQKIKTRRPDTPIQRTPDPKPQKPKPQTPKSKTPNLNPKHPKSQPLNPEPEAQTPKSPKSLRTRSLRPGAEGPAVVKGRLEALQPGTTEASCRPSGYPESPLPLNERNIP